MNEIFKSTIGKCFLYTLLIAFLFCGCSNTQTKNVENSYETIVIEGCEYITYNKFGGNYGYGYMAHKGNCKACTKKNNCH
ncbi:MAG: hypothetical protein ACJAVA_000220 [Flavobacteriaceae bacterium]|jgi:hypothetical protein